jgi:hypothetical protein
MTDTRKRKNSGNQIVCPPEKMPDTTPTPLPQSSNEVINPKPRPLLDTYGEDWDLGHPRRRE